MRIIARLLLIPLFLSACVPIAPPATSSTTATAQSPIIEQSITPQLALERLFREPLQADEWFSSEFLAAVPPEQITQLLTQLTEQLGALTSVEGDSLPYTLVFELGTMPAEIHLDPSGKIIGIFFQPPTFSVADLEEAVDAIRDLPGDVSLLVTKNGEPLAELRADEPFAVASAYKLALLAALRQSIEAGAHRWDEVVELEPAWKAPPYSQLRTWPDNSPITLHTLATLMISISDNTAADALLRILGREQIETITPNSRPLLTTKELFTLKATPNATLLAAYQAGDEADKRAVLKALADLPLPEASEISTTPIVDVEWFFTAQELCALMGQVQDIDLTTVEPGPATSNFVRWPRVAYKGGSELGVLNLTTWLQSAAGDSYCVVLTQNRTDAAIDEAQTATLYRTLVNVLE